MTRSGAPAMRTAAPCLLVLTAALVSSSVGLVFNCSAPACDCIDSSGHVEIPSNYTSVLDELFYNGSLCGYPTHRFLVRSVSMYGVTSIGSQAFNSCYNLTTVDLGNVIQ